MKSVGEIIRERREAAGLTLAALADEVGATKSYLSMIENHRVDSPPSHALLVGLERALKIKDGELMRSANWANTPEEVRENLERYAEEARRGSELAAKLRGLGNLDAAYRSGALRKLVKAASRPRVEKKKSKKTKKRAGVQPYVMIARRVPLINKVAAGYPSDFTDLGYPARVADDYVSCPELTDEDAFACRVVGDSMVPGYQEGDIVVFSPAAKVGDGDDCFVRLEPRHESTFKRVFFEDGKIRLQPLNPKFSPEVYERKKVAGLYKAVWKMQKLG